MAVHASLPKLFILTCLTRLPSLSGGSSSIVPTGLMGAVSRAQPIPASDEATCVLVIGSPWYGPERPRWLGPLPATYPQHLQGEAPADYGEHPCTCAARAPSCIHGSSCCSCQQSLAMQPNSPLSLWMGQVMMLRTWGRSASPLTATLSWSFCTVDGPCCPPWAS